MVRERAWNLEMGAALVISQGMVYRVQCNPRVDAKLIVLMEAIDGAGVEAEG